MLRFTETAIPGAFVVETGEHRDDRGAFSRLYCPKAFSDAGIVFNSTQINLSSNTHRHTLRGMHFQHEPYAEAKFVRVLAGVIFDAIADIRPDSPTYMTWQGFELSRANRKGLLVPAGCAHGFMTLGDDCDVLYQMDRLHEPGHAAGFRHDDPTFAITWPAEPAVMSDADRNWSDFRS